MKRFICIILAVSLIASAALLLAGCGEDEKKAKSATEATKATTATAATDATAPTTVLSTLAPAELETLPTQGNDAPTEIQTEDETENAYYSVYGGLTGQEAILNALSYVGAGYQCVYYDRQYFRNKEAWYIGIQASDGSDENTYYLYINADSCVPVTEIPNIGGDNREDSGVFEESYAGISEQEAIFRVLDVTGDGYRCVSSEQTGAGATEYWLIGLQETDDPNGEIIYFYVNSDSCFQQ